MMWRAEVPIDSWLAIPVGHRARIAVECHVHTIHDGATVEVRPRPETIPAVLAEFQV